MRIAVAVVFVAVVGRKHVQQHRNQKKKETINKQKASEFELVSLLPPLHHFFLTSLTPRTGTQLDLWMKQRTRWRPCRLRRAYATRQNDFALINVFDSIDQLKFEAGTQYDWSENRCASLYYVARLRYVALYAYALTLSLYVACGCVCVGVRPCAINLSCNFANVFVANKSCVVSTYCKSFELRFSFLLLSLCFCFAVLSVCCFCNFGLLLLRFGYLWLPCALTSFAWRSMRYMFYSCQLAAAAALSLSWLCCC